MNTKSTLNVVASFGAVCLALLALNVVVLATTNEGQSVAASNGNSTTVRAPATNDHRLRRDYSIPVVDLNNQAEFHVVAAKDIDGPNQYLGHPSTVLLDDGKSILAAFPTGHGKGRLRLRRSGDGGMSWSSVRAPDIQLAEVPTLFPVERPDGRTRIVLVTCVPKTGELRWMESDDQGVTWSKLKTKELEGTRGIIVALSSLWRVRHQDGKPTFTWRGVFHDYNFDNYTIDLTFERETSEKWTTHFGNMRRIDFASPKGLSRSRAAQLCEAGIVRSPNGKQLALLFRPQRKQTNAMVSLSSDEGLTWSDPQELSGSLAGERHVARYAPDGRLLVTFRDYSPLNPGNLTHADWVAWVGRWEDLIGGGEGQYRVRMKDNYGNSTNRNVGDCGYAGVELLPDGTFVCTSYGHWELAPGQKHPNGRGRSPYIIATRFKLTQLDAMVKKGVNLLNKSDYAAKSSPPIDVFVLTGQSNSLGTTADPKEQDTSPGTNVGDATVKFFWSNRSTRAGDNTANILGDSGQKIVSLRAQQGEGRNKTFWGPEFGFARELYRWGKRNFLIIKASRGGGGNSFWDKKSKDNHMYRHVVDTVNAATEQLPHNARFEIKALLYLQGESNNSSEAAASGQRLAQLTADLKRDLPNARNMQVIVGGISPASGGARAVTRQQQAALAKRDPSINYFDNEDLRKNLYDGLHFNKTAKLIVGKRFADHYLATQSSPKAHVAGFENAKAGRFDKLETAVGSLTRIDGTTIVDNKHAKTGKQCLQLTGGAKTSVVLEIADSVKTTGTLTFWAERWTSRSPFSFRIDKRTNSGWKEIYNGDSKVRVGRAFLSQVKVPLGDASIKQLRFTVKSPPKTGILIDDIRIAPAQPQRIVSVAVEPSTLPVLIGNEACPVLKLKVETVGQLKPISVTSLQATLEGTTELADLNSVSVYLHDVNAHTRIGKPIEQPALTNQSKKPLVFTSTAGTSQLAEGTNTIWITCELSEKANIDHRVGVACKQITFSDGKTIKLDEKPSIQRLGVAVRNGGDDGVHTYRIPGLATTNKGTLIGVYDIRHRGGGDLPGDIDVGMSRSTDGGRTWQPMKAIMDMGDDPKWRYDGVGDPAVLVDRNTGTIWVAATWSHGNRSWRGSGPGLTPEETGQLMLARSDDDGVTWSKPINITKQIKKPEWCFILQGPGKGITMRDGTIVFAAQYQDPPDKRRLPHSTIIYSKDHGKTWQVGTGAFDDTTESQVVEIEPGVLMLNCRYNRKSVRVVMTTRDMGKTWQKHTTSERALIEPRSCMASLINVDQEVGKNAGGWLLFSNPDSTSGRHHITIKASPDRGKTWPKAHRLLLDQERSAGYSCMSMIDEKTIGILYEGSQAHMTFQRIPLADVVQADPSADSSSATPKGINTKLALRLPQVFGDHMVLQADSEIPIWGVAPANAVVAVTLGNEKQSIKADAEGQWQVRMKKRAASASPMSMAVESNSDRLLFKNILIGEIWVCAGQSNMEWPLHQSENGRQELLAADHPQIRLLNLVGGARGSSGSYTQQHLSRLLPNAFCRGEWEVASAKAASGFSAVAWYFGRHLHKKLNVPIGLICPAVGGTPTEAWIARDALERNPRLKGLVAGNWLGNQRMGEFCRTRGQQNLLAAIQGGESIPGDDLGPNHSFKPGFMWSAGIEPLIPFAIRGAVWYQGESNAETLDRVREHNQLFPLMIKEWRERWGQGDFPFLYVQLPALNRPHWPWFREGQRRTLGKVKNVGMAITIDTGHPSNVHPVEKKAVGERLARWALGTTYKQESRTSYSGPLFANAKIERDQIAVSFNHVASTLERSEGPSLRHFEISGEDGRFYPAIARITDKNTIHVSNPRISSPKHVRYAWSPYPTPPVNLVNSDGLPASPFSTETNDTLFGERSSGHKSSATNDRCPNILLIVGEDHGCELSCYGDPVIQTPHIDRLAAQGMLFEKGYVTQSVCSPSRSTLFTGLYPHQNGQLGLATHQYSWFKKWPTTYSLLKKEGYRTGLIGKTHVNPADAIEAFVDFRFQTSSNFAKRKVADYAVKAGQFFRAGDEPFFMTVNYPDAHWPLQGQVDGLPTTQVDPSTVKVMPYIGGETPRMKQIVRNYYDCMLRLDECVGQLLKQLDDSGKADNTLVVFVGDHGAQMARGKVTVYEGGMRVPFIARWPDVIGAGQRSKALVSTIDLLPTFMDAAGTRAPPALPGKSLRPVFEEREEESFRKYLVCERNCDAAHITFPQRTIRDDRYKLIHSPVRDREDPAARYYREHGASHWAGCLTDKELASASTQTKAGYARWLNPPDYQLYDLNTDPHEWKDLASDPKHEETKQRLIKALKHWQLTTDDPIANAEKLKLLMAENDAVTKAKRRVPAKGWQYLKYLAPKSVVGRDQKRKHPCVQ